VSLRIARVSFLLVAERTRGVSSPLLTDVQLERGA
jgi:hypothetical protein